MDKKKTTERVKELVNQMTLEEKISQMLHYAPAIERLGIPAYNWWNEALHGVARAGVATVFPQAIGLAAIFDEVLLQKIATIISDEARAKHHEAIRHNDCGIYKGLTFWSPNINIFRDPRWGRGQETYGEDPYLTSRLGVSFINGLQGDHPEYLKVAACAKHFAVHSGPEDQRHSFDAKVSKKDLYETYLPAFESAVKEARVEAVMGAYNRVNGEPCCGSQTLLQQILRDTWGFEGHVVSDCWAICDFHVYHKVTTTPQESATMAVKAGSDLNCGKTYASLLSAVEQGLIDESDIDQAVIRLFNTRFKLGMFDQLEDVPYTSIPYEIVDCDKHKILNEEAAIRSIVLLKNDGILPLNKKTLSNIAVIGPNADDRYTLIGNYSGTPSITYTALEGIEKIKAQKTRLYYAKGCELDKDREESLAEHSDRLTEAVAVASRSDVVILCLGLNASLEGEQGDTGNSEASSDKTSLLLPGLQNELLEKIIATGTKTIVVNFTGSPIDFNLAHDKANAVIQAWYPGAMGGLALAKLLFGYANFSARLPITFVKRTEDLPHFTDYSMKGRTYRYIEKEPLYPFGYGLSYSQFNYTDFEVPLTHSRNQQNFDITFNLENQGDIDGIEIIQIYIKALDKDYPVPHHSLCHFQAVPVAAKTAQKIIITLSTSIFTTIDLEGQKRLENGQYEIFIGGQQPDDVSEKLTGKSVFKQRIAVTQ